MDPITTYIIEDEKIFAESICFQLESQSSGSVKCVGFNTDAIKGIIDVLELIPDVILIDLGIYGSKIDGLTTGRYIKKKLPNTKLVVVTKATRIYHPIVEAMEIGFTGYVLKDQDQTIGKLVSIIKQVYSNSVYVSPKIAAQISKESPFRPIEKLTEVEKEIARHIAEGLTNKEISQIRHMSVQNVKNRASEIYSKLNLRNRVELTTYFNKLRATGLSSLLGDDELEIDALIEKTAQDSK